MLSISKFLKGLRILNDADQTKQAELAIDVAATTNTKTLINIRQSGNRTLSTPNDGLNTEILTSASAQTITAKTIVVASNTVTTSASGNLVSTELNAALSELQTDIDGRALQSNFNSHLTNTIDAHDASAISVVPSGNLSSTDVQAALLELQSDINGIGTFATQQLNNLTSTAVNANITPAVNNAVDLGETTKRWRNAYSVDLFGTRASLNNIQIGYEPTLPGGGTSTSTITSTSSDPLYVITPAGGLFASQPINLNSGNATGANQSGSINLRTGSIATGSRGDIVLDSKSLVNNQSGVEVKTQSLTKNVSLTSNTSNEVITALITTFSNYKSMHVKYGATVGTVKRTGTLHIACDGANVAIADSFVETAATSLSFNAIISGSDFQIRQSNVELGVITITLDIIRIRE